MYIICCIICVCKLFNQPKCATSFKLSHFSSLAYGALQSLYCCFFLLSCLFLFWVAERWKLVARQSHGHYLESHTSTTAPRSYFTTGGIFSWNVNLCVTSRRENCRIRKNAIWLGVKWYHGDNDDGGWWTAYIHISTEHTFFFQLTFKYFDGWWNETIKSFHFNGSGISLWHK